MGSAFRANHMTREKEAMPAWVEPECPINTEVGQQKPGIIQKNKITT